MNTPPSQETQDHAEAQAATQPPEELPDVFALFAKCEKAALLLTPSPVEARDLFAPVPDIEVGPFKVRRFVDRDFVFLANIGHPLNCFTALAERKYNFVPTGELAWQLCWLLTRPVAEVKAQFKRGPDAVKEAAADEFGVLPIFAIAKLMAAIARQVAIYTSSVKLNFELKEEGEKSADPAESPPLP
jgi:hypothetical protein